MKKFSSIAAVVALLFVAALYYGNLNKKAALLIGDDPDKTKVTGVLIDKSKDKSDKGDKKLQPVTKGLADGTLKLSSAISHGYVSTLSDSDLYATIDIHAIKYKGDERPPLNIAVVIDRSGSMSGPKIEHAKQAARKLIDHLSAQDRLSIVSYGTSVTVDFESHMVTPSSREMILRAIDRIEVSGGTNLEGGYKRGLAEVQRWKSSNSINRVILMSDGKANIGVVHKSQLAAMSRQALQSGASLSTVGVGLDYNEDIMTAMANEGAGNYYFVDNAPMIAKIFSKELTGLSSTVARNTVLMIDLMDGVQLQNLYGFPFKQVGHKIMISLAEFSSEQSKNVLLKLKVPKSKKGRRDVLRVAMSYTDLINHDTNTNQTVGLHAVATDHNTQLELLVDKGVISRVQQIEVATSMQQAMEMYSKGDTHAAVGLINAQDKRMRKARARYKLKSKSFDRVAKEMKVMNTSMQSNASSSSSGRRLIKAKKARSNYIMFDDSSF